MITNEWIEWNGGEMPVSEDAVVEYKRRNGKESINLAGLEIWEHSTICSQYDIIAYRLSKEQA